MGLGVKELLDEQRLPEGKLLRTANPRDRRKTRSLQRAGIWLSRTGRSNRR